MLNFSGLWKHQNNPACTKTRHSLQYEEAEEEEALQAGSYATALLHDES